MHKSPDKRNILAIVDEEYEEALYILLRIAGHKVFTTNTNITALDLTMIIKPDIIVVSMNIQSIDGFTIVRNLRRQGYRGPIVGISSDSKQIDDILKAGCNRVMERPTQHILRFQVLNRFVKDSIKKNTINKGRDNNKNHINTDVN